MQFVRQPEFLHYISKTEEKTQKPMNLFACFFKNLTGYYSENNKATQEKRKPYLLNTGIEVPIPPKLEAIVFISTCFILLVL